MDVREKLVELLFKCAPQNTKAEWRGAKIEVCISQGKIADYLVAHGVTVQENCKACAEATKNCIVKLQEQIAELRSVQEWISVKDRLPEQGQEVIVYDGGVLKPKVYCYLFWNKDYDSWARVTHWLPLPPTAERRMIMATCKNCIHCDACDMMYENLTHKTVKHLPRPEGMENCPCFQDKEKYKEK